MSDLIEEDMARIQVEWREAFAALVHAAKIYKKTSAHRCAQGYQEFVHLSSAAIALYQVEEHYPLEPMMDVWPREGWGKTLHEAAVAWAELSVCVPRRTGDGDYATLSIQRMRSLQHTALDAPSIGDTVYDGVFDMLTETRAGD